ncbi:hypothetical protein Xph01_07360 [Micromonospora phaseoli]|nr:hypothetical protein Xph01_07360 [Micromonospora phaseoli]
MTFGGAGAPGGTTNPVVASASPPTTRCSATDGGGVGRGDRTTFGATAFGQGTVAGDVRAAPTVTASAPAVAGIADTALTTYTAARARSLMNTQTNGQIGG